MTQFLPPNLLAFFAPREPIPYLPPTTKLPFEKKTRGYGGVGQFLHLFEDPKDTPLPVKIETKEERLERKKREKAEKAAYIKEQGIALWDPHNNSTSTSDPYKTLFIARINIDTSESKLRKEFESYGTIRKITMIFDKISGKQKGYAFIEYENEKDMHSAYKHGDGKKIDGRRVLVDVERGRTVKGWLPRRLGGGLSDSKPRISRDEREEKNFRDRFDRRDKERSRRSRSKERTDRKRRSKSRERERDRGERDRGRTSRDRDRNRDRGDRHKDRYERGFDNDYSEQKVVAHNNFNDGDSSGFTATRRNRSRSRERKRYVRSRSRSGSRERKRSRAAYGKSENNGTSSEKERHGSQQFPSYDAGAESGEIEEGEDRSFDTEYRRPYGNNNNGQTFKTEDYDDEFQDTYNQPAYVAYNTKDD